MIGTAGHIDHGKSALVRALTGIEPDRWEEERRRGITIDLGFAHTPLDYGNMKAMPLIYQPFMVALPATHKAAARQQVRLSDLEGEAFLVGPRDALDAGAVEAVRRLTHAQAEPPVD